LPLPDCLNAWVCCYIEDEFIIGALFFSVSYHYQLGRLLWFRAAWYWKIFWYFVLLLQATTNRPRNQHQKMTCLC